MSVKINSAGGIGGIPVENLSQAQIDYRLEAYEDCEDCKLAIKEWANKYLFQTREMARCGACGRYR